MDERLRPVWEVPFPAVTVCPETRLRTTFFNYTDVHQRWRHFNITRQEFRALSATSLLCDTHLFQNGSKLVGPPTIDLLEQHASPLFNETVFIVSWQGKIEKVPALFQPLMTEEGLCYSFNMLHYSELFSNDSFQATGRYLSYEEARAEHWSPDGGYTAAAGVDAYPRRALGAGALLGLSIVLQTRIEDMDFLCKGPAQGFKIQLHNPAEFPQMAQQYFRAQHNHDLVVAVSPQVMSTSQELRSYRPTQRQCFFAGERPLRYFRAYTQQNCALECLANATFQQCGCFAFYMPRDAQAPVCGTGSINCVKEARDALLRRQVERSLSAGGARELCDCLQPCSALAYTSERSQANYDWDRLLLAMGESSDLSEGKNMARVYIFFREGYFLASRRSELYGNTDFLANCGGLLGLGLGVSVLSLVELLYWLLPRILCCQTSRLDVSASTSVHPKKEASHTQDENKF